MSVNKVILVGRLGKDPETRYMPNGEAVTNAALATSENWKDKGGERQERTEWHNLVFYRKLAEIAGEYLRKGSQVYIEGRLQTRTWEKDGIKRYTTEIIVNDMTMLGGRAGSSSQDAPDNRSDNSGYSAPQQSSAPAPSAPPKRPAPAPSSFDNFDDDIPF